MSPLALDYEQDEMPGSHIPREMSVIGCKLLGFVFFIFLYLFIYFGFSRQGFSVGPGYPGACSVHQAVLGLIEILQPLPAEHWDQRREPPLPSLYLFLK